MTMDAKVSVIIPVYNAEPFIGETIRSVLAQTYRNLEVLAIDDGSKDKSGEIIRGFTDPRVRYLPKENGGVSRARNFGIERAQGEFIALLDHDDTWLPEKLERQMPLFEDPGVGLVFSDSYKIDATGKRLGTFFMREHPFRGEVAGELLINNFVSCLTAVIRKKVFDETGMFDPRFSFSEEYDLFLRIALEYRFDFVASPLANYRVHESNFSRNRRRAFEEEITVVRKFVEEHPGKRLLPDAGINGRLADLHYSMGRFFQSQRDFTLAEKAFGNAIRYRKSRMKPYIALLASRLKIGIPLRETE